MGRISEFIFDNVEDWIKSILLRRISFVNEWNVDDLFGKIFIERKLININNDD